MVLQRTRRPIVSRDNASQNCEYRSLIHVYFYFLKSPTNIQGFLANRGKAKAIRAGLDPGCVGLVRFNPAFSIQDLEKANPRFYGVEWSSLSRLVVMCSFSLGYGEWDLLANRGKAEAIRAGLDLGCAGLVRFNPAFSIQALDKENPHFYGVEWSSLSRPMVMCSFSLSYGERDLMWVRNQTPHLYTLPT